MANNNINDDPSGNYILNISARFSTGARQKTKDFKLLALGAFVAFYLVLFLATLGQTFILGAESQWYRTPPSA